MPNNILIEGAPGVGKTTAIERAAAGFGPGAAGFTTTEVRRGGSRTGFRIRSLDGREGTLADAGRPGPPRVGRYGVNLKDLEEIGVAALERGLKSGRLIVIDEIGKMELFSERFRRTVVACLDSPVPVLAAIMLRPDPFTDGLKARDDVTVIKVARENRDSLPSRLIALLSAMGPGGSV